MDDISLAYTVVPLGGNNECIIRTFPKRRLEVLQQKTKQNRNEFIPSVVSNNIVHATVFHLVLQVTLSRIVLIGSTDHVTFKGMMQNFFLESGVLAASLNVCEFSSVQLDGVLTSAVMISIRMIHNQSVSSTRKVQNRSTVCLLVRRGAVFPASSLWK